MAKSGVEAVMANLGLHLKSKKSASWLDLFDRVEAGFPLSALDQALRSVAPNDATLKYAIVPKATLARRIQTRKLSAEESAKLVRLARIWAFAKAVWQDEKAARQFLFEPHMLLQQRKPIDLVLANEIGATLVTDILGRLHYGSAA